MMTPVETYARHLVESFAHHVWSQLQGLLQGLVPHAPSVEAVLLGAVLICSVGSVVLSFARRTPSDNLDRGQAVAQPRASERPSFEMRRGQHSRFYEAPSPVPQVQDDLKELECQQTASLEPGLGDIPSFIN